MPTTIHFGYKGSRLLGSDLTVLPVPGFKHIGILVPKEASPAAIQSVEDAVSSQLRFLQYSPQGEQLIQSLESDRPFRYSGDRFLFGTADDRVLVPSDINTVYTFFDTDPDQPSSLDTLDIVIDGQNVATTRIDGTTNAPRLSEDWQESPFANQAQLVTMNSRTYTNESLNNSKISQLFTHETVHGSDHIENIPERGIQNELNVNLRADDIVFNVDPTAIVYPFYSNVFHDLPPQLTDNIPTDLDNRFIRIENAVGGEAAFFNFREYQLFRSKLLSLGISPGDSVTSGVIDRLVGYIQAKLATVRNGDNFETLFSEWRAQCLAHNIVIRSTNEDPVAVYHDQMTDDVLTLSDVANRLGVNQSQIEEKNTALHETYSAFQSTRRQSLASAVANVSEHEDTTTAVVVDTECTDL